MLTYEKACDILSKGRNPNKRTIANNTILHRIDHNTVGVQLHKTDVVTIDANNVYSLDSGGWRTVTTKSRINEYSPACVSSIKGEWVIWKRIDDSQSVQWHYHDGISVDAFGRVINPNTGEVQPATDPVAEKQKTNENNRLRRQIGNYAKGFVTLLGKAKIELPSAADCLLCQLAKQNPSLRDTSHIQAHFAESYFVPSLLFNAIDRFPVSQIARQYLHDKIVAKRTTSEQFIDSVAEEQITKSLKRYLLEQFGLQA